jgi:hypothetical protein
MIIYSTNGFCCGSLLCGTIKLCARVKKVTAVSTKPVQMYNHSTSVPEEILPLVAVIGSDLNTGVAISETPTNYSYDRVQTRR